jgi:hypothetical protein
MPASSASRVARKPRALCTTVAMISVSNPRVSDRHQRCQRLAAELGEPAAAEQAVRAGRVDRSGGKQAGGEQAGQAADAVHRDDVQGVVEAEAVLEPDGERGADSREDANRGTADGLRSPQRPRLADLMASCLVACFLVAVLHPFLHGVM